MAALRTLHEVELLDSLALLERLALGSLVLALLACHTGSQPTGRTVASEPIYAKTRTIN